jgi:hypothetical protein
MATLLPNPKLLVALLGLKITSAASDQVTDAPFVYT